MAAVGLLAVGGHFMWKGFTLFEHVSFGSVYIMTCLFNEVAVYKPVTSKAANRLVFVEQLAREVDMCSSHICVSMFPG